MILQNKKLSLLVQESFSKWVMFMPKQKMSQITYTCAENSVISHSYFLWPSYEAMLKLVHTYK